MRSMGNRIKLPNIDFGKIGNALMQVGKTTGKFVDDHMPEFFVGALSVVTIDNIRVRLWRKKDQKSFEENNIKQQTVIRKHEAEINVLKEEAEQAHEAIQKVDQLEAIVKKYNRGRCYRVSRFKYTESERQINSVLKHQDEELKDIHFPSTEEADATAEKAAALLRSLGYQTEGHNGAISISKSKKVMVVPTWEEVCTEAERHVGLNCGLESIFTEEELQSNELAIKKMNAEFNAIHHLDVFDVSIAALAALVGAAVDILLVGIPEKTPNGLKAGVLSDYIRDYFDKKFPEAEMKKLANSKESKVPFDAQDNRHTTIQVEGLSAYYHRLLQLGHDPILGFIFGVADILTGKMTTIDKTGKFVSQVMENYADCTEADIFAALAKQIAHFKSDVTTSMGLPAPLMSLFNLLQFGSIGEEELTIAEIVQGMYYEGYDFIHFCSMSVPAMIVEVIVRLGYAIKRIKEGHSVKDSIPLSLNREKHPKLATMLFIGHAGATAANAGKVYFTKNPVAINYPQWIAFAKYSYSQLKWAMLDKPALRDAYIRERINDELDAVLTTADATFERFSNDYIVVFN